ncbi:hypothetical protein BKA80DRAFT_266549 [Phyllosticta citrichinensis]
MILNVDAVHALHVGEVLHENCADAGLSIGTDADRVIVGICRASCCNAVFCANALALFLLFSPTPVMIQLVDALGCRTKRVEKLERKLDEFSSVSKQNPTVLIGDFMDGKRSALVNVLDDFHVLKVVEFSVDELLDHISATSEALLNLRVQLFQSLGSCIDGLLSWGT